MGIMLWKVTIPRVKGMVDLKHRITASMASEPSRCLMNGTVVVRANSQPVTLRRTLQRRIFAGDNAFDQNVADLSHRLPLPPAAETIQPNKAIHIDTERSMTRCPLRTRPSEWRKGWRKEAGRGLLVVLADSGPEMKLNWENEGLKPCRQITEPILFPVKAVLSLKSPAADASGRQESVPCLVSIVDGA
ncbi:hypothetical protein EDB82DRAFT_558446 [Fusarium venenatum]|uniref:uncharacterized protein n=1 Tax=Fusarium venenatum TaxID=56646 RepID=UPI001D37B5B8|nr:hypothetical protein EDB82DRAFT_558446 [Fusarium venenatum]